MGFSLRIRQEYLILGPVFTPVGASNGLKILVFGDSFVTVEDFALAFREIAKDHDVRYVKMAEARSVRKPPDME